MLRKLNYFHGACALFMHIGKERLEAGARGSSPFEVVNMRPSVPAVDILFADMGLHECLLCCV